MAKRLDNIIRNKSLAMREKVRKALTGRHLSDTTKEKLRQFNLGKKHSDATKKKISEISLRLGLKPPSPLGKKHPPEFGLAISKRKKGKSSSYRGEKHWNWKGGITPIHLAIRESLEYKIWRRSVFERDNYTCIFCGDNKGGNLIADHIKPFSLFPELRFAIDNGRTLCKKCDNLLGWKGSHVIKK
jgi:hypothetical protein